MLSFTNASNDPKACGSTGTTTINLSQTGGLYRTSQGTLRVLVVFVRFKDDNAYNPHWPAGSPPNVMNDFIDPNVSTNSSNLINLTHYFDEMSMGTYDIIGEAIYVETPHNKSYYGSYPNNRVLAHKDVLQNVVDPLVNFNDYDNWTYDSTYSHTNQPDGTVDMIIMVWRGLVITNNWLGEASLGYGSSYTVEGGTKTIKNGFGGSSGSGFTAQDWGERSEKINFHTLIHEFAHWLLGANHPYSNSESSNEHAYWGMLHHSGDGICANTYERERLAWINPTEITSDIINAPLNDYLETGVAYKFHPTNGSTNEYYYFENHQKLNIYDDATQNSSDKGIFILHFQNAYNSTNNSRCKTSDGQWNWASTDIASCFGGTNNVREWTRLSVNRAGSNTRDKMSYSGFWDWIWSIDSEGCLGYVYGNGVDGSFKLTNNNVFSPKSNPCSTTWNNVEEDFTMEVTNQSGTIVNARFYITSPYAGKPSKPQNLKASGAYNQEVTLTWEANIEPDMINGGKYKIYRSEVWGIGEPTSWIIAATINAYNGSTPVTSYTDNESLIYNGPKWLHYKITALDNTQKESVASEKVKINGRLPKIAEDSEIEINDKLTYSLNENYPNPFNPTTQISYEIPDNDFVTLKVYNSLGQEIRILVNDYQSSGYYNIKFDGSELSSGIYFYKLQAGENVSVKKMLLAK